eukprot:RCo047720
MGKWTVQTPAVSRLLSERTSKILISGTEQQRKELVPVLQQDARNLFLQLAEAQALVEVCFQQRSEYEGSAQVILNFAVGNGVSCTCEAREPPSREDPVFSAFLFFLFPLLPD